MTDDDDYVDPSHVDLSHIKSINGIPFADMFGVAEADRLMLIGYRAMKQLVGVLLETDQPEKQARYIAEIERLFPTVKHMETTPGLTKLISVLRFGPRGKPQGGAN